MAEAASVIGLASSVLTIALIAVIGTRSFYDWAQTGRSAAEEIQTLLDESKYTRHALDPIEDHVRNRSISEADRQLVLGAISRLHVLEGKLQDGILRHLRGRVSDISAHCRYTAVV
jgi:hypothetical protein